MGYYEEGPPRHGHRTPADLAEEETFAALHGRICMPARERTGPPGIECIRHEHVALIPWADAHPLDSTLSGEGADTKTSYSTPTKVSPRSRKPRSG